MIPKVSVIIPVYGVEEYIERCARSLFEQTLDDIEYIFVNDCTPDRSVEILLDVLEEYPNRFHQVKVVNMDHNSGQAAVRRKGIEIASGEYVIHCDSDDFVDKNIYKKLYDTAIKNDADIVVCDLFEGSEDNWQMKKGKKSVSSDMVDDILLLLLSSLWNKLVRASIVKNPAVIPPIHNTCEDLALTIQYSLMAHRICYVEEPLYYYCRRPNSILGNRSDDAMLSKNVQMVSNFDIAIKAIKDAGKETRYKDGILHECLWIKNQLLPVLRSQNFTKLWRNTYKKINSKVLFSKVVSTREKLNFVVTYLGLYPLFYRLRRV